MPDRFCNYLAMANRTGEMLYRLDVTFGAGLGRGWALGLAGLQDSREDWEWVRG